MSTGKDTPVPMIADPLQEFANANEENIEVIADRYVVTQLLGQGGMGRVFRAHDNLLDRDVAVKLLNRELRDDYFVRRFQQEARAASQLNHPNILCVLDFGLVSQTQPYLIMEWVDGLTLDQVMDRKGRMSIKHAVEICIRLCEGMQHAHRHGIIHRDLKPSNIMLSNTELGERVLILDFGIAKMVDAAAESGMLTMTGQIIGSPRCISPEQARGEQLDGRSDIYSLGCVMFEMFSGKPPYRGDTAIATIAMHLNEPVPSITEVSDTNFPEGLEAIIQKAMAKLPADRFSSMEELANELKAINLESIEDETAPEAEEPNTKSSGIKKLDTKTKVYISAGALIVTAVITFFVTQIASHDKNHESLNPSPAVKKQAKEQFDDTSAFLGADDSAVKEQIQKRFKTTRGLDDADMVIVNSAKSGADLQNALDARPKGFHLRMYDVTITPDMVDVMEQTSRLREVRTQSGVIPPELQIRICKMTKLTTIKFVGIPVSIAAIKQCSKLPNLIDFQMYDCKLNDQALTEVANISKLESLEIKNDKFSSKARAKLAKLKKLKKLVMDATGIDDSDLHWISELEQLETLGLTSDGPFTPQGLRQLTKLQKLKSLFLDNTNINSASLMSIAKIANLQVLDISNNKAVTVGGLQHLAWRPELQVVVFKTGVDGNNLRTISKDLNIRLVNTRPTPAASSKVIDFLLPNG